MKKNKKNRYGVKIGDIFYEHSSTEDTENYFFYQVVDLRGETQVVVREISSTTVAFDWMYDGVVPLPGAYYGERLIRRVDRVGEDGRLCIKTCRWAFLEKKEMYIKFVGLRPHFGEILEEAFPEIADQFCLGRGSGIFAKSGSFEHIYGDYQAILRYPDGREQEIRLKDKKIIF